MPKKTLWKPELQLHSLINNLTKKMPNKKSFKHVEHQQTYPLINQLYKNNIPHYRKIMNGLMAPVGGRGSAPGWGRGLTAGRATRSSVASSPAHRCRRPPPSPRSSTRRRRCRGQAQLEQEERKDLI